MEAPSLYYSSTMFVFLLKVPDPFKDGVRTPLTEHLVFNTSPLLDHQDRRDAFACSRRSMHILTSTRWVALFKNTLRKTNTFPGSFPLFTLAETPSMSTTFPPQSTHDFGRLLPRVFIPPMEGGLPPRVGDLTVGFPVRGKNRVFLARGSSPGGFS